MWLETRHKHVDQLGHESEQTISINMDQVLAYHKREDGTTRLYFELGHDVEDHRSASWMDVLTTKDEIDHMLSTKRTTPEPETEE